MHFQCSPQAPGLHGYWSSGYASPSLWPAAELHEPDAATSGTMQGGRRKEWETHSTKNCIVKTGEIIQSASNKCNLSQGLWGKLTMKEGNWYTWDRRKSCNSCSWWDSAMTRPSRCTTLICSTPIFNCSWMDLNTWNILILEGSHVSVNWNLTDHATVMNYSKRKLTIKYTLAYMYLTKANNTWNFVLWSRQQCKTSLSGNLNIFLTVLFKINLKSNLLCYAYEDFICKTK